MAKRTFPEIDFTSLSKGDVLSVEKLETLFGHKFGTDKYRNNIRSVLGEIKKYRPDLYPRTSKGSILIMIDGEACEYNAGRIDTLMGSTLTTIRDQSRIDRNELSDNQRKNFDAHLQTTGAVALQLAADREKLRLTKLLKG